MSAAGRSSGASHERLGKREKNLLSIIFYLRRGEPGPTGLSDVVKILRIHLFKFDEEEKRREISRYKRALLRLHRRGFIEFKRNLLWIDLERHKNLRHRFPILTEKGIEAARRAAIETSEKEVVYLAIKRLRMMGNKWATVQAILDEVWKVSREKKLFSNREEFEEYWTKRKLAFILKRLNVRKGQKRINGREKWGYALVSDT